MKGSYVLRGLAFALATITITVHAQTGGFTVTERGADYKVLQKTTVEHGTNRVHRYTELATGMNYTNASGQLTESREQISLLPTGGAAATQGRHKVYFPADLYNGVIEVVTPDGRHLKSRPLGVSYDDGSNTVWIATLKHSVGYLTSSNQVTWRDAFNGFKADIVANYRRGGFECDLVCRTQPPTPDQFGLDNSSSTFQLVTEFFNTADPQEIPAASDDWFGLQDSTLKFGKLTMTHGQAFAFKGTNASLSTLNSPTLNSAVPVYKSWLHSEGRTFLIETVPLLDIAEDLDALPLTAQNQKPEKGNLKPESKTLLAASGFRSQASGLRTFPSAHGFVSDTNQIQLASIDLNKEPGVVLDYNTIDSDQTDFTFQAGTTYYVSGYVNLSGTTTFEGGAVLKFNDNDWGGSLNLDASSTVVCSPASEHPTIFTSFNDDSVGQAISGSSGNPSIYDLSGFFNFNCPSVVLSNMCFNYVSWGIQITGDIELWNCRFVSVDIAVSAHGDYNENGDYYGGHVRLHNVLFQEIYDDAPVEAGSGAVAENVTLDGFFTIGGGASQTNCLIVEELSQHNGIPFVPGGDVYVSANGGSWVYSSAPVFQTAGAAHFYLATSSPYRNIGTTNISTNLLADLRTMTTYAPQDGGMPDTNAPDLGYHYPVNEDSDHDGLPDSWEVQYFGNLFQTSTNLDGNGNTLLHDYENNLNPTAISFTVHLGNQHFNMTNATGSFLPYYGVPCHETVLVNSTNFSAAVWSNYDGNVHLNLGTTDGVYQVWFGLKGYATNAEESWIGTRVYLDRIAPTVIITNPTNLTTSVPYVQLQGCSPESLLRLTFDLSNAVVVVTNQPGILSGRYLDTNLFAYTTNYFQCYDIPLTNGVNAITVHATDLAGNTTTTNLNFTLDYSTATNPVIRLTWPQNGMQICGTNFTVRGWVDDPTAIVFTSITATNGDTNCVSGVVERTGVLWAENLPLNNGTNLVTLSVTNAAGLSSRTNISVVKSDMTLALTSISGDLWLPTVDVSGTVSDTNAAVWVNGVQGTNNGNGTWSAANVPATDGGVASFEVQAIPAGAAARSIHVNKGKDTELIMESAIWSHSDFLESGPVLNEGTRDSVKGSFEWGKGGTINEVFEELDTNQMVIETGWIDSTLSPNGNAIILVHLADDPYGPNYTTNDGPYTGNYSILKEIGTLSWRSTSGMTQGWDKSSQVCMVLHTGGKGKLNNLFQWTATAAEITNITPTHISVAGKTLDTNAVAYEVYPDNASVDCTPFTFVPYYSFTVAATKYNCSFIAYAEEPNPGGPRIEIFTLLGLNAGHAWWQLHSDAPLDGLYKAGISIASLSFLNTEVGYFPTVSISSLLDPVPGYLKNPGNGERVDAFRLFKIGFDNLKGGLDFTSDLSNNPGQYSLYFHANNCTTKTFYAGAASGVTLPNDSTPQYFGVDLDKMPNQ